jgi:hypothetical protein
MSLRFHDTAIVLNPAVLTPLSSAWQPLNDDSREIPRVRGRHLAVAVCTFTQAHTAFLSSSVSFASGCIVVYSHGGILPVEMSPHMESSSQRPNIDSLSAVVMSRRHRVSRS